MLQSGISVSGRLRVDRLYNGPPGHLETVYEDANLIVDNGFAKMATLLAFGALNNSVLSLGNMVIGFNPSPLTPTTSDTSGTSAWALGYAWALR